MKTAAVQQKPKRTCPGCREVLLELGWERCPNCGRPIRNRVAPVPSRAEIRERAAIERQSWDEETFEKRRVCLDAGRRPYTIPVVRTPVNFNANGAGNAE